MSDKTRGESIVEWIFYGVLFCVLPLVLMVVFMLLVGYELEDLSFDVIFSDSLLVAISVVVNAICLYKDAHRKTNGLLYLVLIYVSVIIVVFCWGFYMFIFKRDAYYVEDAIEINRLLLIIPIVIVLMEFVGGLSVYFLMKESKEGDSE